MNDEPRILAGRYEVGDLIGRGGMAEVHIGYDTRLGRSVAIKILRADLARDPSFQTRFRREAQAAAGLNHPSIVAVYDTGEDQFQNEQGVLQAVPFIVMEYVEGHTVRDILRATSPPRSTRPSRSPRACSRDSTTRTTLGSSTATSSPPT